MELLKDEAEGLSPDVGEKPFRKMRDVPLLYSYGSGSRAGHAADKGKKSGLA